MKRFFCCALLAALVLASYLVVGLPVGGDAPAGFAAQPGEAPWFRDATIAELTHVLLPSPHHLYWPALDVDLAVESLDHPEKYPLVSRAGPDKRLQPTKAFGARQRTRTRGRPRRRG